MEIRHVITEFTEPITALPTDPQLAPEELKRRLQAPAEELRAAHNALAKEVGGIADATYPDTVTEAMLTPEVKQEIAAKAEQSALEAETAARESADSALSDAVAHKCELFFGSYTGTGISTTQAITLGFRPRAVLVADRILYGDYFNPQHMNLVVDDVTTPNIKITDTGFEVSSYANCSASDESNANPYRYIAFK